MTITEIENLTYEQIKRVTEVEETKIKEHEIIFADLGEGFGYSALIFKNGKQVYHANQYALHFPSLSEQGREALKERYVEILNNKLFIDEELLENVHSYDEYSRKEYFLRNLYIQRFDYMSAFYIGKEEERKLKYGKRKYPYYNPVSFCYVSDPEIIRTQKMYEKHLLDVYKKIKDNQDSFREMIAAELSNHEACVTCDFSDALRALGLKYDSLKNEQKQIVEEELRKQINSY